MYRDYVLSENSFPSAHLLAHHEKKVFFGCDACPNTKDNSFSTLIKRVTKKIMLMKYIQVKFVDPGSWQTRIGVSATVSALKRNDLKIRITKSPVKRNKL
jgi:hypothetical protein